MSKVLMKKPKLTGRGGPGRGQGRHPKLDDAARLSVNIEAALLKTVDVYCTGNQVTNKSGGTRSQPRGDVVSTALSLFLQDPVRSFARALLENPTWALVTDGEDRTWITTGSAPESLPILVGASDSRRNVVIETLVQTWLLGASRAGA